MTETPLHLRRGQTKGLTAVQKLELVFDISNIIVLLPIRKAFLVF